MRVLCHQGRGLRLLKVCLQLMTACSFVGRHPQKAALLSWVVTQCSAIWMSMAEGGRAFLSVAATTFIMRMLLSHATARSRC